MEGFGIKTSNKTYTQSQTIVVSKDQLNAQFTAENGPKDHFGIREIISQKNDVVNEAHFSEVPATES